MYLTYNKICSTYVHKEHLSESPKTCISYNTRVTSNYKFIKFIKTIFDLPPNLVCPNKILLPQSKSSPLELSLLLLPCYTCLHKSLR